MNDMDLDASTSGRENDLLDALALLVPVYGWSMLCVRKAATSLGIDATEAVSALPQTPGGLVEAYFMRLDRRMAGLAGEHDLGVRISERLRSLIMLRLAEATPHKVAIGRALAVLAHPQNFGRGLRITARTVDEMWHLAGDRSADISWYTKRAILAGIWTSVVVRWLSDRSDDITATVDYLDRRLADVARISKLRAKRKTV